MWLFSRLVFLCVCVGNVYVWVGGWGGLPLFFRGSLGSGVGGLTMGWRFGCINKLPYSKLSAVTRAKGLVISLFSLRGKKGEEGRRGGVSLW